MEATPHEFESRIFRQCFAGHDVQGGGQGRDGPDGGAEAVGVGDGSGNQCADGVTVIPVAKVAFGFGGGAEAPGYIEIRDGPAAYKPIRGPWADVVLPLAALVTGGAVQKILRLLRRRGREPALTADTSHLRISRAR
ncbi:GerW family sporulation protein [Streptomyces canus]|uniref:GerW family sporulation protein n=1 Tax=Streptomyces canus TaxID=58343 RepID=UPI00386C1A9C|nr:GerW family sporulation protein [Streptomyces canus]